MSSKLASREEEEERQRGQLRGRRLPAQGQRKSCWAPPVGLVPCARHLVWKLGTVAVVIRPQQSHVQDFVLGPGKDFHLDFMFPGGKHLQEWLVIRLIQCQTNKQNTRCP